MEAPAAPTRPTPVPDKRSSDRLDKAHQATGDAKEMAKLVAQYFGLRVDEQRKQPNGHGRASEGWQVDDSAMWAVHHLVELTARADKAVEEAMR